MAHVFDDESFKEVVLDSDKLVVVDLWAEWCGPCRLMGPAVDELSTEYDGKAVIGKLNVDNNPNVPTTYNVRGIPTFLFFKEGKLIHRETGAVGKAKLEDAIKAHI